MLSCKRICLRNWMIQKLGLKKCNPTKVALQMVDRSIKRPRGIVENVLVKVDKFIFPMDFLVLDMEEDENIPIILGRQFLATGSAVINVKEGTLSLSKEEDEVTFNMYPLKSTNVKEPCFNVETITAHPEADKVVKETRLLSKDALEKVICDEGKAIAEGGVELESFRAKNEKTEIFQELVEVDRRRSKERGSTVKLSGKNFVRRNPTVDVQTGTVEGRMPGIRRFFCFVLRSC